MNEIYREKLSSLQKLTAELKLWVSLDETTDVERSYIVCFIFGILGIEEERGKCYLANIQILQKVNHSTIPPFFDDTLRILWPQRMHYENIFNY